MMTADEADAIQKRYRFSAKVDTICLSLELIEPAVEAAVRALTGPSKILSFYSDPRSAMTDQDRDENRIRDLTPAFYHRVTIEDPTLEQLHDDVVSVAGAYGLRDVRINRLDLAFDGKLQGQKRMDSEQIDFFMIPLQRMARASMVPLSHKHDWRYHAETYYSGHKQGNLIRIYYKQSDAGICLDPQDRTVRAEISLGRKRLSHRSIGLDRFSDLHSFKWSKLAQQIRFRADDGPIQSLNNKVSYALRACERRDWSLSDDKARFAQSQNILSPQSPAIEAEPVKSQLRQCFVS